MNVPRNDILRKHGVIPEKPPSPTPILEEAIVQSRQKAYEQRLDDKQLDELNELEDEEDEEFLNKYRYCVIITPAASRVVIEEYLTAVSAGKSVLRSCPSSPKQPYTARFIISRSPTTRGT